MKFDTLYDDDDDDDDDACDVNFNIDVGANGLAADDCIMKMMILMQISQITDAHDRKEDNDDDDCDVNYNIDVGMLLMTIIMMMMMLMQILYIFDAADHGYY